MHMRSLGFPIWLPLVMGVLLFWAGHLLAGDRRHTQNRVVKPPHIVSSKLIAV